MRLSTVPFCSSLLKPTTENPKISSWLQKNTGLPFPSVLIDLVAQYCFNGSTVSLFVSHRKWESKIQQDQYYCKDGFVPTIPQRLKNPHDWAEKCFEVYLDLTLLNLDLPVDSIQTLEIENKTYYASKIPFPGATHYLVLKKENKTWIWNPKPMEYKQEIGFQIGKEYHNWILTNQFYAKSMLTKWECQNCRFENQITQHCCQECLTAKN
jgi:hypothetical protein